MLGNPRAGGSPFPLGWWYGSGFAWPTVETAEDWGTGGAPPVVRPLSGSVWLGRTRYDVQLGYGWPPQYRQNEDGSWEEVRFPADEVPLWDGAYWTQADGVFVGTVTAATAPEPGTLALAGIGLCAASAARRRRRPKV